MRDTKTERGSSLDDTGRIKINVSSLTMRPIKIKVYRICTGFFTWFSEEVLDISLFFWSIQAFSGWNCPQMSLFLTGSGSLWGILEKHHLKAAKQVCVYVRFHFVTRTHSCCVWFGQSVRSINELFVGRVDAQGRCAVHAAHYLAFVRLSRRSHRHGNAKQWAPLKRLSSLSSPSLSLPLLSSLRPFHLFHPQQSDGGEQQDGMIPETSLRLASFPSNSPNVVLVCQRKLTFQGLWDHFFLWEHLFIFS